MEGENNQIENQGNMVDLIKTEHIEINTQTITTLFTEITEKQGIEEIRDGNLLEERVVSRKVNNSINQHYIDITPQKEIM
jgi:hypothetical protein